MLFKNIVGQKPLINDLLSTVKTGKIAHGQLFCGKPGYGSFALAWALSRYMLCENPSDVDACGSCPSCNQVSELQHPDLHFVYPVVQTISKTSKNLLDEFRNFAKSTPYFSLYDWIKVMDVKERNPIIGTEESKEMLKKISLKSFQGGYKIMIIFSADAMNADCSNKLLKILEEPPPKTLFILIADDAANLLATIQSRMQKIWVPKLESEDISKYLQTEHNVNVDEAMGLASFSDGDLCHAVDLLSDQDSTSGYRDSFIQLMRSSYKKDVISMMNWAEETANLSKERQKLFLLYVLHLFRQSMVIHYMGKDHVRLTQSEWAFMEKFSPYINGNNIKPFMETIDSAYYHLERNANAKILFTQLSFQSMRFLHRA